MVEADRSETCSLGEHRVCVHVYVHASGGVRVGEVSLCSCYCHQPCPVGGQEAVGFVEWRSACTCPGAEAMRRIDPEVLARRLESVRRDMAGEEDDARAERAKQALAKGYEAAAAQAAGQPVDPDDAMENPQVVMQLIADTLAGVESEAAAARRLGLSEARVAELRESAMEFHVGMIRGFNDSRRKRRRQRGN